MRRKIVSVTPAMGASTVAGETSISRMRKLRRKGMVLLRHGSLISMIYSGGLVLMRVGCARLAQTGHMRDQRFGRTLGESFYQVLHGMRSRLVG